MSKYLNIKCVSREKSIKFWPIGLGCTHPSPPSSSNKVLIDQVGNLQYLKQNFLAV